MIKAWFLAIRPWSLTAAAIPILFGTMLAWQESVPLNVLRFIAALLGGMLLQVATNLFNTWGDYVKGVDTIASAHSCPELVNGTMKPEQVKLAGLLCLATASLFGSWLVYECGWVILGIGILGVLGAYGYTAGPCPFKYQGLGTLFVFFLMGPCMILPAYYIQTEQLSWLPLLASLPISCLVTAILHANDLRDLADDRAAGVHTLALALGLNKGMFFYFLLYGVCFLSLLALIMAKLLPFTAALTFLLLILAYHQLTQARLAWLGNRILMIALVRRTAAFHCIFGFTLMLTMALSHI